MSEPFIGEIRLFPFTFAPKNWAFCEGQLMNIQQNDVLYSLVGTTYGGNGTDTFALPDLRGRVPVHKGMGTGLTPRSLGQVFGTESVSLTTDTMPRHNHELGCTTNIANSNDPATGIPAAATVPVYSSSLTHLRQMDTEMLAHSGGGQPHYNLQPFLVLHYCIALKGIFPPRS